MSFHAANGVRRTRPRVLIVDQHEVSRAAYTALLRTEGLHVVANVALGCEGVAAARELSPDIAVVDVTPGDARWLGALHRLQALPHGPAVVLTSSANRSELRLPPEGFRFLAKADICADSLLRASGWLRATRSA